MRLAIQHRTHYQYNKVVEQSIQYLRLTPRSYEHQIVHNWELCIPGDSWKLDDGYGNIMHVVTIDDPHDAIELSVRGEVELRPECLDMRGCNLSPYVFLRPSPLTHCDASLCELAQEYVTPNFDLPALEALMAHILVSMPYQPGSTHVAMTASQAWQQGAGVCQDHSHVLIACCRHRGIPARYVSGYIYTDDSEHVAMHAWCEVWLGDHWQMADITNSHLSPHRHLKLAVGGDYLDTGPVRGVRFGGGEEYLSSVAQVNRVCAQ